MILLDERDEICTCDCGCRFVAQRGDIHIQRALNGREIYYTLCPRCQQPTIFIIDKLEQIKPEVKGEIVEDETNSTS